MINRKFKTTLVLLILLYSTGQAKAPFSFYNEIREYDLTSAFNPNSITDDGNEKHAHQDPLGFIGDDYQRFQIHFTSFLRSKDNPYIYLVSVKTKFKNIIRDFNGTIKVVAAGFSNNQFRGSWTSYKTGVSKKCNWGDGRILDSGDLEGGAGEFINEGIVQGDRHK